MMILSKRRFLITGGAGFIGSRLAALLLSQGAELRVLDDLSSGLRERLPSRIAFTLGDVRDPALVHDLAQDCDGIFHLAAVVSVQDCIDRWSEAHSVNLGGSINVFEAAVEAGGVPVIFASSAAVYGRPQGPVQAEGDLPSPVSPYGADKLAAEHHAAAMAEIHGLRSMGLRFFNVYGEGQDPASPYAGVIARFLANRADGRPHVVFGNGEQVRDFVHVDDVAKAMQLAQRCLTSGSNPSFNVLNICTGKPTRLLELIEAIDDIADLGLSAREMHPPRAGDILQSLGSPNAARATMGFLAQTTLRSGLERIWQATQANGSLG